MIERCVRRMLLILLSSLVVLPFYSSPILAREVQSGAPQLTGLDLGTTTNVFHPLVPGPIDGPISYVTARMLERYHYLRRPSMTEVSSRFLDRYLETFDPQHLHFLQSDLADFEIYRTNLNHLTLPERRPDARPAYVDFQPLCRAPGTARGLCR